ncbi:hypothetical protein S83_058436, partial [Arachis hypogaea]
LSRAKFRADQVIESAVNHLDGSFSTSNQDCCADEDGGDAFRTGGDAFEYGAFWEEDSYPHEYF